MGVRLQDVCLSAVHCGRRVLTKREQSGILDIESRLPALNVRPWRPVGRT
jgi:hypothetical protein